MNKPEFLLEPLKFYHNPVKPVLFNDELSVQEEIAKLVWLVNELFKYIEQLQDWIRELEEPSNLKTARKIELTKDVVGETLFDGSKNVEIISTISEEFKNNLIDYIVELFPDIDYSTIENMIQNAISNITPYELPIASESILGGIKVGEGLGITDTGVLYVLPPIPVEPVEPEPPKQSEYYDLGELEYTFNTVDSTAICTGYKASVATPSPNLVIPNKVIKDDIEYLVTEIGIQAFRFKNNIETITFSENLVKIGREAFKDVAIGRWYNIELPNKLEYIGMMAFNNMNILNKLVIPESMIEIKSVAFNKNIPQGVEFSTNVTLDNSHPVYYSFQGSPTIPSNETIGTWFYQNGGWYKEI